MLNPAKGKNNVTKANKTIKDSDIIIYSFSLSISSTLTLVNSL